jgi:fucose 4-O-acetylase-like acetyltransferase
MRERIKEVSQMQSFGIFLVVFGHSYVDTGILVSDPVSRVLLSIHNIIYSFHMPLFVFISGFLFFYTRYGQDAFNYGKFMYGKVKRLLVPYVVLTAVAFPIKVFISKYAMRPISFDLKVFLKSLVYPFDNPVFFFWFLPTLFGIFVIAPLFLKIAEIRRKNLAAATVTILLFSLHILNPVKTLFLNLNGIIALTLYFWLGCLFFLLKDAVAAAVKKKGMFTAAFLSL